MPRIRRLYDQIRARYRCPNPLAAPLISFSSCVVETTFFRCGLKLERHEKGRRVSCFLPSSSHMPENISKITLTTSFRILAKGTSSVAVAYFNFPEHVS